MNTTKSINSDHVRSAIATPAEERTPYESGLVRSAEERLADMRRRAQTTQGVDWEGVRRASAHRGRTDDEWALVDAYGE